MHASSHIYGCHLMKCGRGTFLAYDVPIFSIKNKKQNDWYKKKEKNRINFNVLRIDAHAK